jgi:hypothetical protein
MMIFILTSSGSGGSLPLDPYSSNLWAAYGLEQLRTSYTGPAIRVRRSSDDAEDDIDFVAGVLDTAGLAIFVGANDAFITTWYDQSGGGHHLVQASDGAQPRIVHAGVLDAGVVFDGASDILVSPNSGTPSAFTVYLKGSAPTTTQIFLEQSANYNTHTGAILYYESSKTSVGISQTTSANVARSDFDTGPSGQVLTARFDRSGFGGANKAALFDGGTLLTRSSNGDAGAISGNFDAAPWYVGARSGPAAPSALTLEALVIYETAHSDSVVDAVSDAIG